MQIGTPNHNLQNNSCQSMLLLPPKLFNVDLTRSSLSGLFVLRNVSLSLKALKLLKLKVVAAQSFIYLPKSSSQETTD